MTKSAAGDLKTVIATARKASAGKPSELRKAISALDASIRDTMAARGLPVVDAQDEPLWRLVVPVSDILRQEAERGDSRSAARLASSRDELVRAAVALDDPAGRPLPTSYAATSRIPVVIPGPQGRIPIGTFGCQPEGRSRQIYWWRIGQHGPPAGRLTDVAGRDSPYRFSAKAVWDQVAHDMVVVVSGYWGYSRLLPAPLRSAVARLGQELAAQYGHTDHWQIHTDSMAGWLTHHGFAVLVLDDEED